MDTYMREADASFHQAMCECDWDCDWSDGYSDNYWPDLWDSLNSEPETEDYTAPVHTNVWRVKKAYKTADRVKTVRNKIRRKMRGALRHA